MLLRFSLCLIFCLSLTQNANAQELLDRQEAHEKAFTEFLTTHFFENGRGMTISPDLSIFFGGFKKGTTWLEEPLVIKRFGFLPGITEKYVGVSEVSYAGMDLAVLGCAGCHAGRAAGVLVPGLGNKTIDPFRIGQTLKSVQSAWQGLIQSKIDSDPNYAYVHSKAMNFATVLADPDISNLTKGLVPDSVIKTFFYRDTNTPYGPEIGRTQVKVPSLWGFAEKRKVGVFADGSLSSLNYAWAFGAELMASDSGEHLRASLPRLKHFVDNVVGNLLPPPYPFKIDPVRAERGRPIVEKNCFGCHGQHPRDPQGYPVYLPPQLIPQNAVGTDPQRLDYGNSLWVDLAEQGSIGDLIAFNHEYFNYGYFAPKLWGIWSRFPYLHNGSIPTLYHLFLPPSERPIVFSMEDAGELWRYDRVYAGLTTYRNPVEIDAMALKAEWGDRNLYFIERPEHSNIGHYFPFMEQWSYEDRLDVIEYLKTL